MAKPEWGTKRTCQDCGVRFYDLRRDPAVCPACNTVQEPGRTVKPRRSSMPKAEPVTVARTLEADDADEVVEDVKDGAADEEATGGDLEDVVEDDKTDKEGELEEIESEGEDLIEDTSDLGEDDDDIGEVIEHIDEDMEDKG